MQCHDPYLAFSCRKLKFTSYKHRTLEPILQQRKFQVVLKFNPYSSCLIEASEE